MNFFEGADLDLHQQIWIPGTRPGLHDVLNHGESGPCCRGREIPLNNAGGEYSHLYQAGGDGGVGRG
jgi:hypothetical protein